MYKLMNGLKLRRKKMLFNKPVKTPEMRKYYKTEYI